MNSIFSICLGLASVSLVYTLYTAHVELGLPRSVLILKHDLCWASIGSIFFQCFCFFVTEGHPDHALAATQFTAQSLFILMFIALAVGRDIGRCFYTKATEPYFLSEGQRLFVVVSLFLEIIVVILLGFWGSPALLPAWLAPRAFEVGLILGMVWLVPALCLHVWLHQAARQPTRSTTGICLS